MIIEVDKKYFIGIIAIMLILGGTFFVISYGTSYPASFGHSANEIEGVCRSDGTGCPVSDPVPTGLYGHCYRYQIDSSSTITCEESKAPTFCQSNSCACPVGYQLVEIGKVTDVSSSPFGGGTSEHYTYYSCYKN